MPLITLFLPAKYDPVKRPVGMMGGLWLGASSGLCKMSHVRAFVYTLGSQALSGNDTMQIGAYYATDLFMQEVTQVHTCINHKTRLL